MFKNSYISLNLTAFSRCLCIGFLSISSGSLLPLQAAEPAGDLADIPMELREKNWTPPGNPRNGSCSHASVIVALRYYGMDAIATWWRKTYIGADHIYGIAKKLDKAQIEYAYTDEGSVDFLDWAARNRQCIMMYHVPASHAINMIDFNEKQAVFLDNNDISQYTVMSRTEFLKKWLAPERRGFNPGWALVIVKAPPPPIPVQ